MPGPAVTAFAETAALYAVLNEDMPEAHRLVNDMLPSERATFANQLYKLADLLGARCEGCDALTPIGTSVTVNPLSPDRKYLCKPCADKARSQSGLGRPASELPEWAVSELSDRGIDDSEVAHFIASRDGRTIAAAVDGKPVHLTRP